MKRKREVASHNKPPRRVRDAFSRAQLAEAASVIIAWNHLEMYLDDALGEAMWLPDLFINEVVSRIHGIDGKIALLRMAATDICLVLKPDELALIKSSMDAVAECKNFRDAVAHARASQVGRHEYIVTTAGARGASFDLLFTAEALALLARRIEAVTEEVSTIFVLYSYKAAIQHSHDANRRGERDQDIEELELDARRHTVQLAHLQKKRSLLPPLPAFPKEPPIHRGSGVSSRKKRASLSSRILHHVYVQSR